MKASVDQVIRTLREMEVLQAEGASLDAARADSVSPVHPS
jgi:hypothetical protein